MKSTDRRLLRDLIQDGRSDVLTLYVPVDPTDARNQRAEGEEWWRAEAVATLRRLESELNAGQRSSYVRALEQLRDFAELYRPDERALAVFADGDGVLTVPLQVPVEATGAFGPPLVGPLAEAVDANRRYLVVLVTRDRVRAVELALGESSELTSVRSSSPWSMGGQTRSGHRFRFEARREQYQRRFHDSIADRIDAAVADDTADRIVVSGEAREAHGVVSALAERTAEAVVGVVPAPIDEAPEDLAERIAPVATEYENARDSQLIDGILKRRQTSGAGSVGLSSVRRALEMQLVRRLVVGSGLLERDVVEELLRAALTQGAGLRFITGPGRERLAEYEGVIADLYYNPYDSVDTDG